MSVGAPFICDYGYWIGGGVIILPAASCELPYKGAKETLLIGEADNKEYLAGIVQCHA